MLGKKKTSEEKPLLHLEKDKKELDYTYLLSNGFLQRRTFIQIF